MRRKEYSDDYRYFPDPDIPYVKISEGLIERVKSDIPELQTEKINRFVRDYNLSFEQARNITETRQMADYFEETVALNCEPKEVCNWLTNIIRSRMSDLRKITDFLVKPEELSQLIGMVDNGTITTRTAKNVFKICLSPIRVASTVISENALFQICDEDEISMIVQAYSDNNQQIVEDYKRGREKLFSYFIGQIVKETEGRLNFQTLNKVLRKRLLNE
jgi:aspartyl-tRNA(Asn)/glutamyl-tRNA(Gln) amidotransferase subunit B